MRLLLTNDDGVDADGLQALHDSVRQCFGEAVEIVVVAPDRGRSECGHSVTTGRALQIEQIRPDWMSVDGTPVDCVRAALGLLEKKSRLCALWRQRRGKPWRRFARQWNICCSKGGRHLRHSCHGRFALSTPRHPQNLVPCSNVDGGNNQGVLWKSPAGQPIQCRYFPGFVVERESACNPSRSRHTNLGAM